MEDISSVTALKGNSFQLLLNRGGHPVIHFRSRSLEELKNWMAMLKVGLAKGTSTCCVCACVRASVHACVSVLRFLMCVSILTFCMYVLYLSVLLSIILCPLYLYVNYGSVLL